MTARNPARIFISYATVDGADFAAELRLDLEAQGFAIWQDVVALQGNADWWSQIENALRSKELQHFVLVVTPGALASPVVRREIRLAKQEGKSVWPIRGPHIHDMSKLPRWLGNLYDLTIVERRKNLLRVLELPSSAKRVPMMAPEPPTDFVARPSEYDALKKQLLDPDGDAVAITAALRGAGGYGKTTLAQKLAHDPDINDAYFDGVLWVELGEQGGHRVLALISDLVTLMTGDTCTMTTIEAARTALAQTLGDRRILLVIDDVWQKTHLNPFLQGGRRTTRLVTTRFDRELPDTAKRQFVDAMQENEALKLLAWGLPEQEVNTLHRQLGNLAQKLHEWAQLLKLANGFLRDRVTKYRLPLARTIQEAEQRLAAKGLPAFDDPKATGHEGRHKSVAAAIGINLDLLDSEKRDRFGELGIFPEDADIPIGIVKLLWATSGQMDKFTTVDLLAEFYDLSLLLGLDLDRETIRFHDTTRHFLQHRSGISGLASQHKILARAMEELNNSSETSIADLNYFFRFLPSHLADAGDHEKLDALLRDPNWLCAKLNATHSPQALVADYLQHGTSQMHNLIGHALRLSVGILSRDERQLLPQLLCRLMTSPDPAAPAFLAQVRRKIASPMLLTKNLSLTAPGAESARFEGLVSAVTALTVLGDGRIAAGSYDSTIRLWDARSGAEISGFEGHSDAIRALAVLRDGRLASGSNDKTIRIWDTVSRVKTEFGPLEGHGGAITALAALPDGQLASGSDDTTIRIWNPETGAETARLEGHTSAVMALTALPDGRLVSGSDDGKIRLWDVESAKATTFEGHKGGVRSLSVLGDGRLISGGNDRTVRLWDTKSGAEIGRMRGHNGAVMALLPLPDGLLATGSSDKTIRLWNVAARTEIARFETHSGSVVGLALLADGRLASGANDRTIRLWDTKLSGGNKGRDAHTDAVVTLAALPDGRLASGSLDNTIRLWDPINGTEVNRITRSSNPITALTVLQDAQLASGSSDRTIRIWNVTTGAPTAVLKGHNATIRALTVLPDGRLASGSNDKTIRIWAADSEHEDVILEGHASAVLALAVLPDGSLVSCANDKSIRVWDVETGFDDIEIKGHLYGANVLTVLADGRLASGADDGTIRLWAQRISTVLLKGHTRPVRALAVLPEGRLVSGADDNTIRLWDVNSTSEIARLEIDASVCSLCAFPGFPGSDWHLVAGDAIGRLHWLEIVG